MIRNRTIPLVVALLGFGTILLSACSTGTDTDTTTNNTVPSGCTEVPVATSPEKFTLLTGLAETFNATGQEFDGECAAITVYRVSSGAAARMLSEGWPNDGSAGPAPVLWSPSASTWGAVVNQRLSDQGLTPIANDFQRIMLTPLVLGMPRPMAEAMGWPEADIGWSDILALSSDPEGW
jgi:Ca-activated chloride channel family protein